MQVIVCVCERCRSPIAVKNLGLWTKHLIHNIEHVRHTAERKGYGCGLKVMGVVIV